MSFWTRLFPWVKRRKDAAAKEAALVVGVTVKRDLVLAKSGLTPAQIANVNELRPVAAELDRMTRSLADRSQANAQIERDQREQQLMSSVQLLQAQVAKLQRRSSKALAGPAAGDKPAADALQELAALRELMGAQPGESTLDAMLRKLGTNRILRLANGEMDASFGRHAAPYQANTPRRLEGPKPAVDVPAPVVPTAEKRRKPAVKADHSPGTMQ